MLLVLSFRGIKNKIEGVKEESTEIKGFAVQAWNMDLEPQNILKEPS